MANAGDLDIDHLSGSTDGRGILVAATATPGTTIHTAVAGATDFDLVTLYAVNLDTVERTLTLEYGGTGTGDTFPITLAAGRGPTLIVDGLPLHDGVVVRAFGSSANKIAIIGKSITVTLD